MRLFFYEDVVFGNRMRLYKESGNHPVVLYLKIIQDNHCIVYGKAIVEDIKMLQ